MAYEYEDEDYTSNVLWGRLAALLVLLLVIFFLGRCSAGDAASSQELQDAKATIIELSSENTTLEQQLAAQSAGGVAPRQEGNGAGSDGTGAAGQPSEEAAAPAGDGETYEVQPGDTLTNIAEQFYGDPQAFEPIAEANNLSADVPLQVGQELTIPPAP
ncbi:MAG: LysM peptidoglycan-binding domain-containing protein [Egibacteraceae bacterium]